MTELTDSDRKRLFRVGLYGLAEGLRMQSNGSGDPWGCEKERQVVACLHERLLAWRPTTDVMRMAFDGAVRAVVVAAIEEWRVGTSEDL